jgi:Protein of unknown function (DUF3997)
MTMKYIKKALLASALLLTGCFGLWDSGSDRITGKYIVLWIDVLENQGISEQFEMHSQGSSQVVPAYVFAVGHNDDYIIAKQHPTSGFDGGYKIETQITNYYIVDMNKKVLTKGEKVFGPLTQNQFDSLRTALKIDNIEFDQKYPDKP